MEIDGARNAKAEAFANVFGYRQAASAWSLDDAGEAPFLPVEGSEAYAALARSHGEKRAEARELVALGVLPPGRNESSDKHRLGIFIQHKRLTQHPIVESIQKIASNECDVIYTGPAVRRSGANGRRCRPLEIGASIGHHRVTAGTLGFFARKRDGGGLGMVSNNHIFADTNRGQPGDRIIQPARLDGGGRADVTSHVGTLHKFVRIGFDPGSVNLVDCAFAHILDEVEMEPLHVRDPEDASHTWQVGEIEDLVFETVPVKKVGRTTSLTRGHVRATDVDNLNVKMTLGAFSRIARFDRQIAISGSSRSHFSKGGDSGSMIFTEEGRPVALLFAGTERGGAYDFGITYANPIATVLDALNVDIHIGS